MVFSYLLVGNNESATTKKCRRITGDFVCHADSMVQGGAHCPIEHIQGFTWNPWMLPLGKYLHRIAPAAAMVDKLVETTLNTTKSQHLPSNYGTFWSLVICENFNHKMDPLLNSSMRQASFKCKTPRLELKSSQQGTKSKTVINSLIPIRVRAGTKNYRPIGFLL